MKNKSKFFGIIATVAIIGLSMMACDQANDPGITTDPGTPGGGNDGVPGTTMNLSGFVYTVKWTDDRDVFTRFPTNENRSLSNPGLGLSGTISNGQLNLTVGEPPASSLSNIRDWFDGDGFTISDPNAMIYSLESFYVGNGSGLARFYRTDSQDGMSGIRHLVTYEFVDRNVTIGSERITYSEEWDDVNFTSTSTYEAFTLALRKGWNAIHQRLEWVETETSFQMTVTVSMGDPGYPLRWVFNESGALERTRRASPGAPLLRTRR